MGFTTARQGEMCTCNACDASAFEETVKEENEKIWGKTRGIIRCDRNIAIAYFEGQSYGACWSYKAEVK